jgi:hypothetical protein
MNGRNRTLFLVLAIAGTAYLMTRPRCNAGCRTVLEHLLTHELDLLI